MLKKISGFYLLTGILFYLFFAFSVITSKLEVFIFALLQLLSFWVLINYASNRAFNFYKSSNLIVLVSIYTLFWCVVLNSLSYYLEGNYFVFSEVDGKFYHEMGLRLTRTSLGEGIDGFLRYNSFEDLGMVFITSTIYRFLESNLAVNAFYLVLGLITSQNLFVLAKNFMDRKYSFLCAMAFSCTSFMIWFNSSGLKESALICLVILAFKKYYDFKANHNIFQGLVVLIILTIVLFFRPVISIFLIMSFVLTYLLENKGNIKGALLSILFALLLIGTSTVVISYYNRYLAGGDLTYLLAIRESQGMVIGGVGFTYAVNFASQFLGPFATILPNKSEILAIYAPGLIYRILLSVPFWLGIYLIIKQRFISLLPIVIFVFFEMLSLILILEGLELRKALIHIPLIFVVAFYSLEQFELGNFNFRYFSVKSLSSIALCCLILAMFVWNLRFAL